MSAADDTPAGIAADQPVDRARQRSFDRECDAIAQRLGHDLADDPSPFAQRKTCMTCGRAVLRATGAHHVYGSATTERCGTP